MASRFGRDSAVRDRRYRLHAFSPLQAAAAAGEAAAEEVHALLERHRETTADQFVELPLGFLREGVELGLA